LGKLFTQCLCYSPRSIIWVPVARQRYSADSCDWEGIGFVFSDINISQGSVATRLRCGGTFYYRFSRNLLRSPSVKNFGNQLSFGKVRDKSRVVPFFSGHGVERFEFVHVDVIVLIQH